MLALGEASKTAGPEERDGWPRPPSLEGQRDLGAEQRRTLPGVGFFYV